MLRHFHTALNDKKIVRTATFNEFFWRNSPRRNENESIILTVREKIIDNERTAARL